MNELFNNLRAKAIEHKALLIKAGSAVVGAVAGVVVGSLVAANFEEEYPEDFPGTEDEVSE